MAVRRVRDEQVGRRQVGPQRVAAEELRPRHPAERQRGARDPQRVRIEFGAEESGPGNRARRRAEKRSGAGARVEHRRRAAHRAVPQCELDDLVRQLPWRVVETRGAAAMLPELSREQLLGSGAERRRVRLGRRTGKQRARKLAANVSRRRPRWQRASRARAQLPRGAQRAPGAEHARASAAREQSRGLSQTQAEKRKRRARRAELGSERVDHRFAAPFRISRRPPPPLECPAGTPRP